MALFLGGCGNPYYQGLVTDHFDGKKFSAPEPMSKKSWLSVLKWRLTADRKEWPELVELEKTDTPPAKVEGRELRAAFVNHTTVLLQTQGLNILTDPIWSERASPFTWIGPKRVHEPGIQWNDLPKIDIVLISHSHYDHLDLPTVENIVARDNPIFVVPLGVDTIIHSKVPSARTHVMDWGQAYAYNDKLTVHAEPTQHWSARTPFDRNKSLWASWVMDVAGDKIYFSGDTGYFSGKIFKDIGTKYGPIRFAMIDIGAYEPRWFMKESHINPDEAVMIYRDIKAQYAMPIHYGTFQLSDEAIDQPVKDLDAALNHAGVSVEKFPILKPGQHWIIP